MEESIYRKKSLDNMKTPDTLNQYIQVATPGGWILLVSILCLLIGVIIWGVFGTIETKVKAHAFVENKTATLEVSEEQISDVELGMLVRIGDVKGTVWKITPSDGTVIVKIDVPDGAYNAEIVTEIIKPMSLILS